MKVYKIERWLKTGGAQVSIVFAEDEESAMKVVLDKFKGDPQDWEVMSAVKPFRNELFFNCILKY